MRHLPNAITLLNLICGAVAILLVLQAQWYAAALWLAAAALADFADGLVARALGVASPEGKELDSLADMVSFGLAPGMILYSILDMGQQPGTATPLAQGLYWPAVPAFILPAFSALRLARFNLDERQTEHFRGLATPASTLLVVGLMLL
ncbi:MAG: CDP-alcohol phosphatidyltransferase family protein, partial [Lewinella sp.]|nr:CDP-alcohol phosphatidyltransferase family protein [Lewinella sp.]